MKRLYAFYQAHDITDLADIEKDVSAIITKGKVILLCSVGSIQISIVHFTE